MTNQSSSCGAESSRVSLRADGLNWKSIKRIGYRIAVAIAWTLLVMAIIALANLIYLVGGLRTDWPHKLGMLQFHFPKLLDVFLMIGAFSFWIIAGCAVYLLPKGRKVLSFWLLAVAIVSLPISLVFMLLLAMANDDLIDSWVQVSLPSGSGVVTLYRNQYKQSNTSILCLERPIMPGLVWSRPIKEFDEDVSLDSANSDSLALSRRAGNERETFLLHLSDYR